MIIRRAHHPAVKLADFTLRVPRYPLWHPEGGKDESKSRAVSCGSAGQSVDLGRGAGTTPGLLSANLPGSQDAGPDPDRGVHQRTRARGAADGAECGALPRRYPKPGWPIAMHRWSAGAAAQTRGCAVLSRSRISATFRLSAAGLRTGRALARGARVPRTLRKTRKRRARGPGTPRLHALWRRTRAAAISPWRNPPGARTVLA